MNHHEPGFSVVQVQLPMKFIQIIYKHIYVNVTWFYLYLVHMHN